MSLAATTYVLHRRFGNQTRKLIMIAIADFADDEGKAWPSIDTLAERAECSRRNVQEHLAILRAEGELVVVPNAGRSGTNLYKIIFKKSDHGRTPPQGGANPAPVQMDGGNLHGGGADERRKSAPEPSGTVNEPSRKERAPLPPTSGGSTLAAEDLANLEKSTALRDEWAECPEPTRKEIRHLRNNRRALSSIKAETWPIIRAYLAASIPEGMPKFQPLTREQFLAYPADVAAHSKRWHRKRQDRRGVPPPPPPSGEPPATNEELAEFFRQVIPKKNAVQ